MAASAQYRWRIRKAERDAERLQSENKLFFRRLKQQKPRGLVVAFRTAHDRAFAHTDCLQCANCCRRSLAVFSRSDVRRAAKYLGLTSKEFIRCYLRYHPSYDFLIRKLPCPFLQADNRCAIYSVRPDGCRTYPPARLSLTPEQLDVLHDNAGICPAVGEMLAEVRKKFSWLLSND